MVDTRCLDISQTDFNPTIFFVSKQEMQVDSNAHSYNFTKIMFILSGNGTCSLDGREYEVSEGDIIICNPGMQYQHVGVNQYNPAVEFSTGFTNFHFINMEPNTIHFKNNNYIIHTSKDLKNQLVRICTEMLEEEESFYIGKYFMLKAKLMQMVLLIIREVLETGKKEKKNSTIHNSVRNQSVHKMVTFLHENYKEKVTLDSIAKYMYLSPVYISKIFKEETGESPINYLIKIRLEKAREILIQGDGGSIKQIARCVGYEDVYHFSKLFKKYYGVSPLYFRKSLQKKKA